MTTAPIDAWLEDARQSIARGEFAQAIPLLQSATALDPRCAAAWKALGVAENKLGQTRAAEQHLLRSLELDDSDADAWSSLGGVYVSLAEYEQAMRCFEKGLGSGAPDTYALLNYLTMVAIAGDYTDVLERHAAALSAGESSCERQIEQRENIPWCYFDLAQIHFLTHEGEDFDLAIREGLAHSSPWQALSARRTYDLLTQSTLFASAAREALAVFARHPGSA